MNVTMNKVERINRILKLINENGIMLTKEIASIFPNISLMTLNRDLKFLENSKLIVKVSLGYCSVNYSQQDDLKLIINKIPFVEAKKQIALKALKIIEKKDVIYFSPGTTSEFVVEKIVQECTIFTNSWKVYQIARSKQNLHAILIGGEALEGKDIFVGTEAIKSISSVTFDKTFLSVTGFTKDGDILNTNKEEALIESIAASLSKEVVVIADGSKFKETIKGNYKFFNLENCDYLITDVQVNLVKQYPKLKKI